MGFLSETFYIGCLKGKKCKYIWGIKMSKELQLRDETTDFLIYTTPDGNVKIEAFLHNESIWLT